MTIFDFVWLMFYVDIGMVPIILWIQSRSVHRERQSMNAQIERLAQMHPEQWRRNE